jgi:ATP-dependent DNA helicase RecG
MLNRGEVPQPFDKQPVVGATLDDLDLERFQGLCLPHDIAPEILTPYNQTVEAQLLALGMIDKDNIPTATGILILGKNPRKWIPSAFVHLIKINGTSLADGFTTQIQLSLRLPALFKELNEYLEHNSQLRIRDKPKAVKKQEYIYPVTALRQLVYNGILHRSYEANNSPLRIYWFDDRVEIISPGGPFGFLTPEIFSKPGLTDYRNWGLFRAMKLLGFVNQFGAGIEIARRELQQNGNPELEFEVDMSFVIARVRKSVQESS